MRPPTAACGWSCLPVFPKGKGAEYSTFRNYTIVLEAERLDAGATVVGWHEVLSFQGGGALVAFLEPINGQPQKQLLKQATTYRASQSGEAVGRTSYPAPAVPMWPGSELARPARDSLRAAAARGPPGSPFYTQFKVSWNYRFEDAGPLVGLPTAWPV